MTRSRADGYEGAEQNEAEQNEAEQNKAEQNEAEQSGEDQERESFWPHLDMVALAVQDDTIFAARSRLDARLLRSPSFCCGAGAGWRSATVARSKAQGAFVGTQL